MSLHTEMQSNNLLFVSLSNRPMTRGDSWQLHMVVSPSFVIKSASNDHAVDEEPLVTKKKGSSISMF
jgi:hypothetical protein